MIQNRTGLVIGAWMIVSPWILGFANLTIIKWSSVLCGLLLVLVHGWVMLGAETVETKNNH